MPDLELVRVSIDTNLHGVPAELLGNLAKADRTQAEILT